MINLIKAELYRIFHSKSIYVALSILILILGVDFVMKEGGNVYFGFQTPESTIQIGENGEVIPLPNEEKEIVLSEKIMTNSSVLYYIVIIVGVSVLCVDFNKNTVKNTLSGSMSRVKYYLTKLLLMLGFMTLFMVIYTYGFYIVSLLFIGKSSVIGLLDLTMIFLRQLPLLFGISAFMVLVTFLFKKTAAFTSTMLLIPMLLQVAVGGLAKICEVVSITLPVSKIMSYEFGALIYDVGFVNASSEAILKCVGVGFLYLVVFTGIGIIHFSRCDLK